MPPMLATYAAVAVLLLASALLGDAVFAIAGLPRRSLAAPAVGLATLLVVCSIAIKLPGRATTAAVVVVVLAIASAGWLVKRGNVAVPWRALAIVIPPIAFCSLPFLANGRVGILGVSFDNDMAVHLLWAAGLRSPSIAALYPIPGFYPLGPHSVVATISTLLGIGLGSGFTALLIAVVPLMALAAAAAVPRATLWRQVLIGLVASLAYMAAAYYGEGSFKEPMTALFLLTFVVILRAMAVTSSQGWELRRLLRAGIPPVLLVLAAVNTFSWLAFVWFAVFLGVWALLVIVTSPTILLDRDRIVRWLRTGIIVCGSVVLFFVIVDLPLLSRLIDYINVTGFSLKSGVAISTTDLGNLAGPVSQYAGLGIWLQRDFRFPPTDSFHAGELGAVALAAVIFGAVWALRRRDYAILAGVGACLLISWYSNRTQSPYVTAKALVIEAPLVLLLSMVALIGERAESSTRSGAAGRVVLGLGFAALALYSSSLSLRAAQVSAPAEAAEFAQFRPIIGGARALFLGDDDFIGSELPGVRLGYVNVSSTPAPIAVTASSKPAVYGEAFDFDSVTSAELNQFKYVITTSSQYASAPPANFHLVRALPMYELWEREGTTPPRMHIDPSGAPGAILDCQTRAGERLSKTRGVAAVMTPPVLIQQPATVAAGHAVTIALPLPEGRWNLSLNYTSSETVDVSLPGDSLRLPADLGRPGPYFNLADVEGQGVKRPVLISIYEQHPSRFSSPEDVASISTFAAVRLPDTRTMIPLSRSCGRYIDWYRTG
jgi:hypothetical protein